MIARIVVLLLLASSLAMAAPRKVLVLPLEGTADAPTRTKLTASVQRLARVIDGNVQPGDTTFSDTAAAVGCDPKVPACADSVRGALAVDELVYGTADVQNGTTTVVVRRNAKDVAPREVSATLARGDAPEKIEPSLLPLFSATSQSSPPDLTPIPPDPQPDVEPQPLPPQPEPIDRPRHASRDRNFGIAAAIGGGVLLVGGLAAWSSAGSVKKQIKNHDTDTYEDFQELRELESKASTRAWAGNILVLGGLALGGYGGWLLWRDHQAQATITPTPVDGGGAALMFTYGARP